MKPPKPVPDKKKSAPQAAALAPDRVEGGASEVEASGGALVGQDFRLESGHETQRLRIALESAASLSEIVEDALPVVAEWRVAEVVAEAGGVDDVGVGAEFLAEFAAHLGDFEGVGEAGAHKIVNIPVRRLAVS